MSNYRQLRERIGLTQRELASWLGCTSAVVARYESEVSAVPAFAETLLAQVSAWPLVRLATHPRERHRTLSLPAQQWEAAVDLAQPHRRILLPTSMVWSQHYTDGWPVSTLTHLREFLAVVLSEGTPLQISLLASPTLLLEHLDHLPISDALAHATQHLLAVAAPALA